MSTVTVTVSSADTTAKNILAAIIEKALREHGVNATVNTDNVGELNARRERMAAPGWVDSFKSSVAEEYVVDVTLETPKVVRTRRSSEEVAAEKAAKAAAKADKQVKVLTEETQPEA